MNSILQLWECDGSNYPDYFQAFLDYCLESFGKKFLPIDYVFTAVYFIILERGFLPHDVRETLPFPCTDRYDVRKMRCMKSYDCKHIKLMKTQFTEYWIYRIPLRLGLYSYECELQGVPSFDNRSYLIINLLLRELQVVRSVCLNTENYFEIKDNNSKHPVKLNNLNRLTDLIVTSLCTAIKEEIYINENQGFTPHLLLLPEEAQKKIIYYLIKTPVAVQYLGSTCTYFYNMIRNDVKLWEFMCLSEFNRRVLEMALEQKIELQDSDTNIFRVLFINLKQKKLQRPPKY